jgi:hypothetical protein
VHVERCFIDGIQHAFCNFPQQLPCAFIRDIGREQYSLPIALSVNKAPFAALLCRRLAVLKLSGFVELGLDDPFLSLVNKAPFSGLRLHRSKAFAEFADVAVLGAGRAAGAKAGNKKRCCARAKSVSHKCCLGVCFKPPQPE